MTFSAKAICDSIANDVRLTTLELCYPRFIHSEFMTHRVFSRNASSSRAIPVAKMIDQVRNSPAMPIHWGKNQPGMQAREELSRIFKFGAKAEWREAAIKASEQAKELEALGVHKQIVNRLLEPFQYIKVIVTATEWDNFFNLRLHPDAQPEIMVLAKAMKEAMDRSVPDHLAQGEWHMPYITEDDYMEDDVDLRRLSIARCARVSYNNHDNSSPDIGKDLRLTSKLLRSGHMSPFEHVATPMSVAEGWCSPGGLYPLEFDDWDKGATHLDIDGILWSSNFRGWIQYRNLL